VKSKFIGQIPPTTRPFTRESTGSSGALICARTRITMGLLVVTQEEKRIAIKVCYLIEYREPDEDDWPPIITELSSRYGVTSKVVRRVFIACRNGKKNREKQKEGAGLKHKLDCDNAC
jgi:hypothetical protein